MVNHCVRWVWFVLLLPFAATAAESNGGRLAVLVVLSQDEAIYHATMAGITDGLRSDDNITLRSVTLEARTMPADLESQVAQADIIIPIGTGAASQVLAVNSGVPVYVALVPSLTYVGMIRDYRKSARDEGRPFSAIYVDQPYGRQLDLIRAALPGYRNIGVVLGPASRAAEKQLRSTAEARQLNVHTEIVGSGKGLYRALSSVLSDSEVMLAVPDPDVYNRNTAQNVLLETYRQRKPVIGYSAAYVNAGAVAAVYSTPGQIGRQMSEELVQMRLRGDRKLPLPTYPKYFSVEVNQRVARSLGIEIGDAGGLRSRIAGMEERQ